jgi:hypothetical protein
MSQESSKIRGSLVLIDTHADSTCIPTTKEALLKLLTEKLAVQFPGMHLIKLPERQIGRSSGLLRILPDIRLRLENT